MKNPSGATRWIRYSLVVIPFMIVLFIFNLFDRVLVAGAANGLSVEILAGYNLVVDSNVLSPSTYAPSVATVAGKFCNTSADATLTNVTGYIGDYDPNGDNNPADRTAGIYPKRYSSSFPTSYHLYNSDPNEYYAFVHLGGRAGLGDASRYIGSLAPGECKVQYWSFTYPRRENPENTGPDPVWGATNDPNDDLWLSFDIWGMGDSGAVDKKSWKMTMRNEISAMANKIEPNPDGQWFVSDKAVIQPGDVITSNGVRYTFGNVGKGFDNDGDYIYDYNAWMQPVGDPSYDPGCFRLLRVTGVLTVTRSGGQPDLIIPVQDQLYFTNLPPDNTSVTGNVYYTFMALGGPCSSNLTPYQEAASGADNEKFNGDFGAGIPPIASSSPSLNINKSAAPAVVAENSSVTYTINFLNDSDDPRDTIGMPLLNMPLVIKDPVPTGTVYVSGSASYSINGCSGCSLQLWFKTASGELTTSEPTDLTTIKEVQWWLDQPLPPGASGYVRYSSLVPLGYSVTTPVVENDACAQLGQGACFESDQTTTLVEGPYSISGMTWKDEDFSGTKNGVETLLPNVTVTLYWDKNGDGKLDAGDVAITSQSTTASDPGYTFSSLPSTNYLVTVDKTDTEIPVGYSLTTMEVISIPGLASSSTNNNFGFGPTLKLDKVLVSPSPVNEGSQVTYDIKLTNTRPPSIGGFCAYTVWAGSQDATHSGTGQSDTWTNATNAIGSSGPDGIYAYSDYTNALNKLAGTGFNNFSGSYFGKITKVEALFSIYYTGGPFIDDHLPAYLYFNDSIQTPSRDFIGTDLTAFQTQANQGLLTWDVTANRTWDWMDFSGNLDLEIDSKKESGKDGVTVYLDAIGFRITTDQPCGGDSEDIAVLPLFDTYDPAKLQYISANPAPDETAPAGTLSWTNLGPLFGGQTRTVRVTFLALDPGVGSLSIDNTATVAENSVKFGNGRYVNGAVDVAPVTIIQTGRIGDTVWYNPGGGPSQDPGEPGIPGITVRLCSDAACNNVLQSTVTDSAGRYSFTAPNGTYYVRVTPVTGMSPNYDSDGSNDNVSLVTISGGADNLNQDFGYTLTRIITGSVWEDNSGDAIRQAGENGFGGITITLCTVTTSPCPDKNPIVTTTFSDGSYAFINPNVTNGSTYYVQVGNSGLPGGAATWSQTKDPDSTRNHQTPVTIVAGTTAYGPYDFAYQRTPASSSIGDTIYADWDGDGTQDAGEPGIPGVVISLYEDANGNGIVEPATDALIAQQTTTSTGGYLFSQLAANGTTDRYLVIVKADTLPDGYFQTQDPNQNGVCTLCDNKSLVQLTGTNSNLNQDFGYQPRGSGTIGDSVWKDLDADGTQDVGEPGIANISVDLYVDINANGVYDASDLLIESQVTGSEGQYAFSNLPLATYFVRVNSADGDLPANVLGAAYFPTTSVTQGVTLTTAVPSWDSADFGFAPGGAIGDRIWRDDNANGTQDTSEAGYGGVHVTLYRDGNGDGSYETLIGTATTDPAGYYSFTQLLPGDYFVEVDTTGILNSLSQTYDPDSSPSSPPCAGDCNNGSALHLNPGQINFSQDFGYRPSSSVGGRLWMDTNGNGLQDGGEGGLGNVLVHIYSSGGDLIGTTLTDTDGYYSFSDPTIDPGTAYYVSVGTGLPAGVTQTFERDTSIDNHNTVTSPESGSVLDVDFGYRYFGTSSINGHVFFDVSGAAEFHDPFTAGDTGFQNIPVYLWRNGDIVASTFTDADGTFQFNGLAAGDYTVSIARNSLQLSALDLTATPNTSCDPGCSVTTTSAYHSFTVAGGSDVSGLDFGFNALLDFDDLLDSYATRLNVSGPYHRIGDVYLGTSPSSELDGKPSAAATADTADDGITMSSGNWNPGGSATLTYTIVDPDGSAYLVGWYDFNNDGDFSDSGETVVFGMVASGANLTIPVPIPFGFVPGTTVNARFRVYDSQPAYVSPQGGVLNGEVEGYQYSGSQTTPVTLSYFLAMPTLEGIHFEWSTVTETGNVGFNLYADSAAGRMRVNPELIPSSVIDSLERVDYSYDIPGLTGQQFYLEDLSVTGKTRLHGPFNIGQGYGDREDAPKIDWETIKVEQALRKSERDQGKMQALQARLEKDLGQPKNDQAALSLSYPVMELRVNTDGLYRVSYEQLKEAGLDLVKVAAADLALVNQGQSMPIRVESIGRFFGPGGFIEFYGEHVESLYTDENVYFLKVDRNLAMRIPVDGTKAKNSPVAPYFMETKDVDENRGYSSYAPVDDPWYADYLMVFGSPQTRTYPIVIDRLIPNSVDSELKLGIWGGVNWPADPDHHLLVKVNDRDVADLSFDGRTGQELSFRLPSDYLQEGTNNLSLTLLTDPGETYDLVFVNRYGLVYPRNFVARENRLTFTSTGQAYQVDGLSNKNILVYRLDGGLPVLISKPDVITSSSGYSVRFAGAKQEATYVVSTVDAVRTPELVLARTEADLTGWTADYLIISHPSFIDGLAPFIDLKVAQGFSVKVVDVEDVYAQYGYGIFDPQAIKDFIRQAAISQGVQYVLLVGGDTFDYHNYLGFESVSFIPSLYVSTGPDATFVPSDPFYVDLDGDTLPDLPVGRFPVRTLKDLQLVIEKTGAYMNKDYRKTAVFSADAYDGIVSYSTDSDSFIASLPSGWLVERAYIDQSGTAGAKNILINAMNRGIALTSYVGHSGADRWSFSNLFNTTDARNLKNYDRPTVVVQWGCWNTYYTSPNQNTMAYQLLLSGNQGAAAVLGATTLTEANSEEALGRLLMGKIAAPGLTIGAAIQNAKAELALSQPELLDVLLGWTLLGDPALVVEP